MSGDATGHATAASRARLLRRNALSNIAGRSLSVVVWVFVTPFVLARLGQERFAVWSLFLGIGGNVASLDLGAASSVARFVALESARGDRPNLVLVLRRSLTLSAAIGLGWCLACIACSGLIVRAFHVPPALHTEVVRSLLVYAVSMFVFSVTQVLIGALVGFQRLDLSNICLLSGLTVHAIVLVAGLSMGAGLLSTALAAVLGHTTGALIASGFVRRFVRDVPHGVTGDKVTWREMLRFGGATQGTAVGAVGIQQSWNYLLGILGELRWVTQFALGFRVANAVASLPNLVQTAVIPAAAHASAHSGGDELRAVYTWSCRWIFAMTGYVLAGLWLTAPALVLLWLGPQAPEALDGAMRVARMLAIAYVAAALSGPATAVARGGGWPILEMWNFIAALVLNILISLWLVPRFGPAGAAASMAIAFALAGSWLVATMHRILKVSTLDWLIRLALPRLLVPALVAVVLWRVWPGDMPVGRMESLRVVAGQGVVFTVIVALLSWPTGDPAALLSRLRRGPFAAASPPAAPPPA